MVRNLRLEKFAHIVKSKKVGRKLKFVRKILSSTSWRANSRTSLIVSYGSGSSSRIVSGSTLRHSCFVFCGERPEGLAGLPWTVIVYCEFATSFYFYHVNLIGSLMKMEKCLKSDLLLNCF